MRLVDLGCNRSVLVCPGCNRSVLARLVYIGCRRSVLSTRIHAASEGQQQPMCVNVFMCFGWMTSLFSVYVSVHVLTCFNTPPQATKKGMAKPKAKAKAKIQRKGANEAIQWANTDDDAVLSNDMVAGTASSSMVECVDGGTTVEGTTVELDPPSQ